jgi:ABC-type Na+ efflux pump permease subunit
MGYLESIFFLAAKDLRVALKKRSALMWLFVMPPIFFFFIGNITAGAGGLPGEQPVPVVIENLDQGVLGDHLEARLLENLFEILEPEEAESREADGARRITIPADFTASLLDQQNVTIAYRGPQAGFGNDYDLLRVQKAAYTLLADVVTLYSNSEDAEPVIDPGALQTLLEAERPTQLVVTPAGRRQVIPSGFEQAIPGTLVMFTLLILLTTGATQLIGERESQLLRRLASVPFSRGQIVAGKWAGRMALAVVQIGFALLVGTYLFDMDWGSSLPMVLAVLFAWGALCTSLALLLGSIGKTEGQVSGLGVLATMLLAALGGCWWPIEVAPEWMQTLSLFLPTGWTMDALHRLISFDAGAMSALPHLLILLASATLVGWYAGRKFRFI